MCFFTIKYKFFVNNYWLQIFNFNKILIYKYIYSLNKKKYIKKNIILCEKY